MEGIFTIAAVLRQHFDPFLLLFPSPSCASTVLDQPNSADDPFLADIGLALRSLKTEHLPWGGGDPSGLQEPGFPVYRSHVSNAKGIDGVSSVCNTILKERAKFTHLLQQ